MDHAHGASSQQTVVADDTQVISSVSGHSLVSRVLDSIVKLMRRQCVHGRVLCNFNQFMQRSNKCHMHKV